jgi:FMN phosphatase YigB (HAD superfamily)
MIKAVAFDFRDTLIDVKPGYKARNIALFRMLKRKGIKASDEDILNKYREVINREKNRRAKQLRVFDPSSIFVSGLLKQFKVKITPGEIGRLLEDMNARFAKKVKLYPDALALLKLLKKRKIKTAVVIDGESKRERAIIKRLGLKTYLDVIVISEEVGLNKFTSKPLQTALIKLGVNPEHVLSVGDRLDKDVVHANKLGCVSVRLVRNQGRYASLVGTRSSEKPDYMVKNLLELRKYIF